MVKSSCFKEVLYDGRYNSRLCKEQKEKEDKYTYTIKLNDNASGSKQFSSCGYLWVYSVTDQMFTKYGNGEMPSSWTVGDTYIFFTTEQKNGGDGQQL